MNAQNPEPLSHCLNFGETKAAAKMSNNGDSALKRFLLKTDKVRVHYRVLLSSSAATTGAGFAWLGHHHALHK